ncbi:hypothetical protein HDV00_003409 [Rhizophlyctis rosea]|nr:hypothetical protein HDV00_003409 [Rhizophlyctis rosea]
MTQTIQLPSTLYDSYDAYKRGTNIVISAIVKAASGVLDQNTLKDLTNPPPAPATGGSKRLKGKERKQAKAAQAAKPKNTQSYGSTVLNVTQLDAVVDTLIGNDLTVPPLPIFGFDYIQEDHVVEGADKNQIHEENRSHRHFLTLLEKAYSFFNSITTPKARAGGQKKAALKVEQDGTDNITNKFELLTVEEPTIPEFSPADDKLPKPATPAAAAPEDTEENLYRVEEDRRAELEFAAWCLYEDLEKIRGYMKEVWLRFKKDELTMVTVSCVMTLAVDMAKALEEQLTAPYSEINNHQSWTTALQLKRPDPSTGDNWYKEHKLGMRDISGALQSISKMAHGKSSLAHYPSLLKFRFHACNPPRHMTEKAKGKEGFGLLLNNIGDWALAGGSEENILGRDALLKQTAAWGKDLKVEKIKIHFVFAIQLWRDSLDSMRGRLDEIVSTLQTVAKRIQSSNREYLLCNPKKDKSPDVRKFTSAARDFVNGTRFYFLDDFIANHRKENIGFFMKQHIEHMSLEEEEEALRRKPFSMFYYNP